MKKDTKFFIAFFVSSICIKKGYPIIPAVLEAKYERTVNVQSGLVEGF